MKSLKVAVPWSTAPLSRFAENASLFLPFSNRSGTQRRVLFTRLRKNCRSQGSPAKSSIDIRNDAMNSPLLTKPRLRLMIDFF